MQRVLSRGEQVAGEDFVLRDAGIPYRGRLLQDAHIIIGTNEKPENNPPLRGRVAIRQIGAFGINIVFSDFYAETRFARREIPLIGFPRAELTSGTHSLAGGDMPVAAYALDVDTITTHAIARVCSPEGRWFPVAEASLTDANNGRPEPLNTAGFLRIIEDSAYRAVGIDAPAY